MACQRFRNVKCSAFMTGDLRIKLAKGVKWKGRQAVTSRQLEEIRRKKYIETSSTYLSQKSSNAPMSF